MTSTTSYTAGDLVLAVVPFSSGATAKLRPALVVLDTTDNDLVVARMTTQVHSTAWDVSVTEWKNAGLLGPGVIRLHKLTVLEKSLIHKRIGSLLPQDRQAVAIVLRQAFGNW